MAEAKKNGLTVISMKDDCMVIFAFEIKCASRAEEIASSAYVGA